MSTIQYTWKQLNHDSSAPPLARSSHEVSCIGENLFLLGGEHIARTPIDSDVYVLKLTAQLQCWRKIECLPGCTKPPSARIAHAQAVIGRSLWVFGGREGVDMGEGPLNDLHCFDTTTNQWSGAILPKVSDLSDASTTNIPPPPRSFHKMVSVDHKLYVFGGCGVVGRLADLHVFDTLESTWTALPLSDKIAGRGGSCFAAVQVRGEPCLLVTMGYSGQENNDVHIFNINTNQWTEVVASERESCSERVACVLISQLRHRPPGTVPSCSCSAGR